METPDGVGTVTQVNLLREQVKVHLEDSNDAPKNYPVTEINVVRNGKGKRPEGYVAPPPEELAKLRKITPEKEAVTRLGERSRLSLALEEILSASGEQKSAGVDQQQANEEGKSSSSSRRRRSRSKSKPQPEKTQIVNEKQQSSAKPKVQPKQEPVQKKEQEVKSAPAAQGDAAKKSSSSSRRNRNRRRKPKAGSGAPKAE